VPTPAFGDLLPDHDELGRCQSLGCLNARTADC
jgi:hypothetical protein